MVKILRCNHHRSFRSPGAAAEFCLLLAVAAFPTGSVVAASKPDFGPNVIVFNPSMPAAAIQDQINKVYDVQKNSEFGSARNALLFLPGTYNVEVPVGYYTQVLGLGASPDNVSITGGLHAGPGRGDRALVTFWRAAEGLSVTPPLASCNGPSRRLFPFAACACGAAWCCTRTTAMRAAAGCPTP